MLAYVFFVGLRHRLGVHHSLATRIAFGSFHQLSSSGFVNCAQLSLTPIRVVLGAGISFGVEYPLDGEGVSIGFLGG